MSDYFEGLKLMRRIGVPCKDCATASIWCAPCAARWRKACEEQKRQEQQACPCFPGTCRGGEVINGRLANGQVCAAAAADGA